MAMTRLDPGTYPVVTYFVQVGRGGPIKIGRSTDFAGRMESLQATCPYRLRPVLLLPGDHERHLHFAFRHLRMWGEWFAPDDDLLGLIGDLTPAFPSSLRVGRDAVPIGRRVNAVELGSLANRRVGAEIDSRREVYARKNSSRPVG